jgi:hypothetical protein
LTCAELAEKERRRAEQAEAELAELRRQLGKKPAKRPRQERT